MRFNDVESVQQYVLEMSAQHRSHTTVCSTRKAAGLFSAEDSRVVRWRPQEHGERTHHQRLSHQWLLASGFRAIGATGNPAAAMTTTNPSRAQTPSQRPRPFVVKTRRIIHGTTPMEYTPRKANDEEPPQMHRNTFPPELCPVQP